MGQLEAIVDGFAKSRKELEDEIERLVVADFQRLGDWYSPQQIAAIVKRVAAHLSAGQVGMAQLTEAYLVRATSYVMGKALVGGSVPAVMGQTLRNGVADHEQVYARVAAEYRRQRSLGLSDGDALQAAFLRGQEMVSTDLGLAFQRQSQRFMERNQIHYYRRVVRPEMSKNGSCGLCVAASDRKYRKKDLLPIHARCKCTVICVTANSDPGSQLNDDSLAQLYLTAAGNPDGTKVDAHGRPVYTTYGAPLKQVRVTVFDHPELGPQLRVAGQNIRDLSDAA